ncbi:hypothetical protein M407DRAFT_21330 [Tulasnella calospora MUT 4182]|uniref:F-box domain-containing protein n=1 Tax=Tulasnella calospora MUT 4182 TaxID=1051891 RepID=A0A0C3QQ41_9AGAM|nr:hypothetical protein M407DRAFT_21330 [Tulasnella calospora MUT 4182]
MDQSIMQAMQKLAERCAEDFVNQLIQIHEFGLYDGLKDTRAFMNTLDSFQAWFAYAVRHKIVPRLRQGNASLPISKLPVELMQIIFHATLFQDSGERHDEYVTTLLTLRSVSGAWRELVDSDPSLWTHLSSDDHPSFISKAFEISEDYPLHLMYTDGPVYGHEKLELFWDQALTRLHCWESVSLHDPDWEDLRHYFTHPAPRLKRITLTIDPPRDTTDFGPISLFGGSWESMEEVRINRFYDLEWSGVRCRRLRILEIWNCTNLDLAVILRIIQENQNMEILRLHNIRFTLTSSTPHPPSQPTCLPCLRALTLTDLYFNADDDSDFDPTGLDPPASHIPRHIQFPNCTDFCLTLYGLAGLTGRIDLEYSTTSSSHSPDLFSLPALVTALSAANSLVVMFDPAVRLVITTDDDVPQRVKFSMLLRYVTTSFARSWVGDVVARKPWETKPEMKLVFEITQQVYELDALAAFRDCEAVTELSVDVVSGGSWGHTQEAETLHLLATPYTSTSGVIAIPFPRLRCIHASTSLWDAKGEAILAMITTRFSTPGLDVPETVIVDSRYGGTSFKWPNLDGIRELRGFDTISFV